MATNPHFSGLQIDFELAKRVEQLDGWLAESAHNLSCRSFRVHLEIIHKLRDTKLGASMVMVV